MAFKHIVLFNGYSLAEHPQLSGVTNQKGELVQGKFGDWEKVCADSWFFESPRSLSESGYFGGRIPTALMLASQLDAEQIIWSTGATWLPDGKSEGQYCFERALQLLPQCTTGRSAEWLEKISTIEDKSANTTTSMERAREIIAGRYSEDLIMLHLVSSANHMPRVMREAMKVFGRIPLITLSGVPADTSYGGKTPDDVVIYELGEPKPKAA